MGGYLKFELVRSLKKMSVSLDSFIILRANIFYVRMIRNAVLVLTLKMQVDNYFYLVEFPLKCIAYVLLTFNIPTYSTLALLTITADCPFHPRSIRPSI